MAIVARESGYSSQAFKMTRDMVADFRRVTKGVKFDTLIGRGMSGALVVPVLARSTRKHFALIRKPDASSHSRALYVGTIGERWIFVDDFISSGATLDAVKVAVDEIANLFIQKTTYVGAYLYEYGPVFRPAGRNDGRS